MSFDHIYSCVTRYQLLCMILHRMAHREGTAAIYLVNLTFSQAEIERLRAVLERDGLFTAVLAYDEAGLWDRVARETTGTAARKDAGARFRGEDLPKVRELILEHFTAVLPNKVNSQTCWYVAGDQYSFGLALVFQNIRYVQFEEHSGGYDNPELFLNTFARLNPFQYRVYELLQEARDRCVALHVVDSVSGGLRPDTTQVEMLKVRATLDAMSQEDLASVFAAFDYDVEWDATEEARDSALLITQPFARWKFLDWDQHRELMHSLVDYFAPGSRLTIKPHPQDDLTPYDLWFPGARLAPASVPMELILTREKPAKALTVASTAIFPLQGTATETVFLGQGFEREFSQLPRLCAAATVLSWLGVQSIDCVDGFPVEALRSFMPKSVEVASSTGNGEVLVCWDDVPPMAIEAYGTVLSLSPLLERDESVHEDVVLARLQEHDRPYAKIGAVYLYGRSPDQFAQMKGKTMERTLPHLKQDLTIVFPSDGDPDFLQAKVISLEARVAGLVDQLRNG